MPELPTGSLSVSAMRTLAECPMKWKRRYIDREYEPPKANMVRGSLVGAAETQSDHHWIEEGEPLDTEAVADAYSDEWEALDQSEVDWGDDKPIEIRDSGEACLRVYHEELLPSLPRPVEAEREMRFSIEHPDGSHVPVVGYPDVEMEDDGVMDRKVSAASWNQAKADAEWQPTIYLAGRRAEGEPAPRFDFDVVRPLKTPKALRLSTERSDEELDDFLARILGVADEIAWRLETDNWSYAPPGAWYCSESSCGYWSSCPGGGLFRRRAAQATKTGAK